MLTWQASIPHPMQGVRVALEDAVVCAWDAGGGQLNRSFSQ
jgi:hypothetical protein